MPDWTYQPLRGMAGALLGVRRSRRVALRTLAWTGSLPGGGRAVARLLGHRHPPAHLSGTLAGVAVRSRLGALVPPEVARDAVRALPPLGAGLILVEPVGLADVPLVRQAAAGRQVPLLVRTGDPAVTAALAAHVDAILPTDDERQHRLEHDVAQALPEHDTERSSSAHHAEEPRLENAPQEHAPQEHGPAHGADGEGGPEHAEEEDGHERRHVEESRLEQGAEEGELDHGAGEGPAERGVGEGAAERGVEEGASERGVGEGPAESGMGEGPAKRGVGQGASERGVGEGAPEGGVGVCRSARRGDIVLPASPAVGAAARVLADPAKVVLATPALLIEAGPGWFGRVMEAATPTAPIPSLRAAGRDPRRWAAWWWGLVSGVVIAVAGLVAAAVAFGPVLLWYDRAFLDMDQEALHAVNHHLVHFLRHDRITLAGTMVAIGVLYIGLAAGGMRRGWPWAREAYLVSGAIGFAAVPYLFTHGYVEPLHTALAVVLLPMFLAAARRPRERPRWTSRPDGPEPERRRALTGQLLMVITGIGLFAGGVAVSAVGLGGVFVPSDLEYLGAGPDTLRAAGTRLLPFIAHDRAGFGGALLAAAAAITLLSAWGWRRGEAWVWWTLALAAVAGFVPAVLTHLAIGYVDLWHLAPVLFGMALTATALTLSRPYLCSAQRSPGSAQRGGGPLPEQVLMGGFGVQGDGQPGFGGVGQDREQGGELLGRLVAEQFLGVRHEQGDGPGVA